MGKLASRMDIETIRSKYEQDLPMFERLAAHVAGQLRHAGAYRRIPFYVEWRAKEMHSLLKKVLFEKTKYNRVIDRAGVRVVLDTMEDAPRIDALLGELFVIRKRVDAGSRLGDKEFGYAGIHYHVECGPASGDDLVGWQFECQVHTRAQALWASLSHSVTYKVQPEGPHVRSLNRLAALLEVVDLEIARVHNEASGSSALVVARFAEVIESHYMVLGRRPHKREMTGLLVPRLLPLVGSYEFEPWREDFESFVQTHSERLRSVYERYRDDTRHLLMSQPESLLILYARERDPFTFEERWPDELGEGLRDLFIGIWPNP